VRETKAQLIAQINDEMRAYQRSTDGLDELVCDYLGINRTDGRCIDLLDHEGRMPAGELARRMSLSTGAITTVIDRLEERGMVRRVPDPNDRRKVLVEASPAFSEQCGALYGGLKTAGAAAMSRLSVEDLELVRSFMSVGRRLVEEHTAGLRERLGDSTYQEDSADDRPAHGHNLRHAHRRRHATG
jgi:DNA-binding MarR family transcriptional regulator